MHLPTAGRLAMTKYRMFKTYYQLTKPGIIYGNATNAIAGFFLASQGRYDFKLLMITLIGISLIVASACVFNNIWDAGIDAKMERTKNRAMVVGAIPKPNAIIYGSLLLIFGCLVLALSTNHLALYAGLLGFAVYVFLYTPLKRRTVWGTEIGSISGSIPPLTGYLAVADKVDAGAIILFFIFVFWQMPHFYAIAIYRLKEYAAAGIPVLPVKNGVYTAKVQMLFYIIAFIFTSLLLTTYGYTGHTYFAIMVLLGLSWLYLGIKGFRVSDDVLWAKKMFKFSLIIVLAFCIIIPLDTIFR